MSEPKQVKVDNWGIYFLQRLKHFFNRTDYCDLTLQFQDNAQLKVHRLVLSACTEYFELLERTCEMYEECLVMPDDLQADVVVPIVNFMYTGQLEFKMDILERLHATSEIMNMPVLTKLLDSHRPKHRQTHVYAKRSKSQNLHVKEPTVEIVNTPPAVLKRSYVKAFDKSNIVYRDKKHFEALNKANAPMNVTNGGLVYRPPSPVPLEALIKVKPQKFVSVEPRPTRYELPDELITDNFFENSFANISYTSQPLMVHPTTKQYAKRPRQEKGQASTSKKSRSTVDIVECKKIVKEPEDTIFQESTSDMVSYEQEMFKPAFVNHVVKTEPAEDPNKLFDQLLDPNVTNQDHSAKVTIETTKNNKAGANLDHAKIISEVLKKYPHLVKSNKNIKLKIFNTTPNKGTAKKQKPSPQPLVDKAADIKAEDISDYTFETEVLDSMHAAKLIALGAENIEGPWICLICGSPGKALNFTSYYKFRRHLVEVHNEKPVHNICEFCGQRMSKRNHLLHHMFTKHGVEPPASYRFPKCSQCNYVALTEALLVKHKLSHTENKQFRCNVCPSSFSTSSQLLTHIQSTGHKYIADRKHSHQCIYCLRVFVRENNLYAHLKTHHKKDAVKDGIIDESDDESKEDILKVVTKEDILKVVKHEPAQNDDDGDENNSEYHIEQNPDGNIQLIKKKSNGQKILNTGLTGEVPKAPPSKISKPKASRPVDKVPTEDIQEASFNENDEIVIIDNNEYIMSGNRLILRKPAKQQSDEYILSDIIQEQPETSSQSMTPSTSMEYATILNTNENIQQASLLLKDAGNLSESIPIYVSNEEEYKALITSNHNIIFDSNDANKTLTVLTTPETATLDHSGIDMDNTQNNDMMIMQDEYPLNVSQGDTDNSSIVVVYSHQVSDSNKEYQLLTTQALGPQYAQASAILTHNYETVSTSSPVMSAHILGSQVATWQGEIQQSINNQQDNTSAVLQSIIQDEDGPTMNAPKSPEEICELPQVQLIPNTTEAATINLVENVNNESHSANSQQNADDSDAELKHDTQNMSMETNTPLVPPLEEGSQTFTPVEPMENVEDTQEVVNETEILKESNTQTIDDVSVSENLPEVVQQLPVISTDAQHSDINESAIIMEVQNAATNESIVSMDGQSSDSNENIISIDDQNSDTNENIIIMDVQNSDTNENIISMDVQNSDTNENIPSMVAQSSDANENIHTNIDEPITETANAENVETVCSENELNATDVVEQIQNLTSEWSEDDVEVPTPETTKEAENLNDTDSISKLEDVEESIENIQQELEKQMGKATADDSEAADDEESVQNHDLPPAEDKPETSKVETQVKISSLLNDWDDNDSQEEEVDENESTGEVKNVPVLNSEVSIEAIQQEVITMPSEATISVTETTSPLDDDDDDEVTENTPTDPATDEPGLVGEIVAKQVIIKSLVSDWDEDEEEDNKE